jgi:hypothetical protein
MRHNHAEPPRDVRLAALAARQHGIVTRRQLNALGLDNSAILRRMKVVSSVLYLPTATGRS